MALDLPYHVGLCISLFILLRGSGSVLSYWALHIWIYELALHLPAAWAIAPMDNVPRLLQSLVVPTKRGPAFSFLTSLSPFPSAPLLLIIPLPFFSLPLLLPVDLPLHFVYYCPSSFCFSSFFSFLLSFSIFLSLSFFPFSFFLSLFLFFLFFFCSFCCCSCMVCQTRWSMRPEHKSRVLQNQWSNGPLCICVCLCVCCA